MPPTLYRIRSLKRRHTCRFKKAYCEKRQRTGFQQTTKQFLCRSAECSSQQLRAPPIEASGDDCTGRASISVQSRVKCRAHKRALCGLGTAHLRCHFVKSTFVRRAVNDCFADCDPPIAKRFTSHNGAYARRKPLDFQWFVPAGRRQALKRIISFLMWIFSRRNLQHPNETAMGSGARRDGSDREFGLESLVALAAAIHSVKPRGHPAKWEYPEALLAMPRKCNSLSNSY